MAFYLNSLGWKAGYLRPCFGSRLIRCKWACIFGLIEILGLWLVLQSSPVYGSYKSLCWFFQAPTTQLGISDSCLGLPYIYFKHHRQSLKTKYEEQILKAMREKQYFSYRRKTIRMLANFSLETIQLIAHFLNAGRKEPTTQNPASSENILQEWRWSWDILRKKN